MQGFMQILGPMLAQMAGGMSSQQYGGGQQGGQGGGGGGGQGGGALGGLPKTSDLMARANPVFGAIKGALGAAPPPPPPPPPPGGVSVPASGGDGGGLGMAAAPPQGGGLRDLFGGRSQPLGFQGSVPAGNGGMSGPLPGLGGAGPMPTMQSNFAQVFPGMGMGMAPPPAPGPQMSPQQDGLQMLLRLLQGGAGAGLR